MDRGALRAIVNGVAKSLSDWAQLCVRPNLSALYILTHFILTKQANELDTIFVSILWLRKPRHRYAKLLPHDHKARKCPS